MNLIFDTSIIIEIERGNKNIIDEMRRLASLYLGKAQIPFMVYFEFYHGLHQRNLRNRELSLSFINKFEMLNITKRTAEILSDIRIECELDGKMVQLADLLIASQVIENNGVLVTKDSGFNNIERLKKIIL